MMRILDKGAPYDAAPDQKEVCVADGTLRGVNLAGWLMPNPWVTPSLFRATGAVDEKSLLSVLGYEYYVPLIREHREQFITEEDFRQIAARGYNAVRIPLPWYVLGEDGPMHELAEGMPALLDKAFDWAEASGIQIVLCISMLPGSRPSANGLQIRIDSARPNRQASLSCVSQLSERYAARGSFFGIEPLDSVVPQRRRGFSVQPGTSLTYLRNFYRDAYDAFREAAGPGPAFIISDAGLPGSWRGFMAHRRYENVWLDTHLYHHVQDSETTGTASVRKLVEQSVRSIRDAKRSGLPVMVGEWSAALPISESTMTPEGRIALERVYVAGQLACFEHADAWFFQTWKTEQRLSPWDARIALSSFEKDILD